MIFKKKYTGWILVILISLSPIVPWMFALTPFSLRFMNISSAMTSIGQISALVGVAMFCLSIVLSARLKILEDYFGGINSIDSAHHFFGGIAFVLLLLHPLALAASIMPYSIKSAALYILPGENWSINLGIAGLLLMMSLLILTFFIHIPYQKWLFFHKFLGLAFFIGVVHGLYVNSDISRSPMMKAYMLIFFVLGLSFYVYKTLLGGFFNRDKVEIDGASEKKPAAPSVPQENNHTEEISTL